MVVLASVPVLGFVFGWEWERKWTPLLALARTRDTTLQTLSLRRTARAGSALRGLPGRLGCLVLGRTAGLPYRDSCLVEVRFWQSTACLEEIRIDPAIYDDAEVVDGVVDSVGDDETVAAQCKTLDPEEAVAFLDHNPLTSRGVK